MTELGPSPHGWRTQAWGGKRPVRIGKKKGSEIVILKCLLWTQLDGGQRTHVSLSRLPLISVSFKEEEELKPPQGAKGDF